MSGPTKAQLLVQIAALEAQLIERGRELEALRLRVSIAERNNVRPAQQRSLPMHFAAAREAAMRMGKSVRVTAGD